MQSEPAVVLGDLSLVRPLARAGIPAIVATANPHDPTLRSRFARDYLVLPGFTGEHAERSLELLESLGRRLSSPAPLLYGSDPTLAFVHRFREELTPYYRFLLNEPETCEALLHKDRFAQLCDKKDVRVPRTFASTEEVRTASSELTRPIVVKPHYKAVRTPAMARLFGSGKAAVFPDARTLLEDPAYQACRDAVVVQERIPGAENHLYSFHGFATEEGKLLAWFLGRKVRTYPRVIGNSSCIELVLDERVMRHGMHVATALGLRGVFKIDLIEDERTGELFALEVNARFNLWHRLGAIHGVNLPAVACAYLRDGIAPSPGTYQPTWRWFDLYRDFKSFQQSRQRGDLDLSGWVASFMTKRPVFDCFAWNDPGPAIFWASGMIRDRVRQWRPTAS